MSTLSTKITEKMVIDADGKDIVLNGLDFTENGYIELKNANSVVVKNCRVYKMNCENAASNQWLNVFGDIPVQVKIVNCFFGDNPGTKGVLYNLINLHAKLKNKSSISSNYFTRGCCTHNRINVYDGEENATIYVNNNYIGNAGGAIRIGTKGSTAYKFVAMNNENVVVDPTDFWNNHVLAQPAGGVNTKTFGNVEIIASNNKFIGGDGADPYLAWCGASDMLMSRETAPKLTVDGKPVNIPIRYHSDIAFVAVIGTTGYNTLAEAIAAANGSQITLMKSVEEDVDLTDVDLVAANPGLTVNGTEIKF